MVPLLKNPPDAQNVSETTFIEVAAFVSIFHKTPHADAPSITSGFIRSPFEEEGECRRDDDSLKGQNSRGTKFHAQVDNLISLVFEI
jgi:hypothetical protein